MNQTKLIVRLGVALLLLAGPFCATAVAAPSKADAEQTPAKTVTVRGVVYDDQGLPLPGASVMVKGTTQGTITDLDGQYSLNVRPDQTLVISFIGMKDQEIPVNGQSQVNVAMASQSTTLDDVVVVGYGAIKKAHLTAAVDAVGTEMFENRVAANVDHMLQGNVPSVNIAITDGAPYRATTNYNIRGDYQTLPGSSAGGDFSTLILIDGVEGDPTLINPNDIESVSVLKDAASAAIYGSRGSYGVVLITTKNPQKGEKISVNYTGNFSVMTPRSMPELLTDGEKYMDVKAEFYYGWNGKKGTVNNLNPVATDPSALAEGYRSGLKGVVTDGQSGAYTYYGGTDWFSEIYKKYTTSQIHNVSINGNSGKASYLVSGRFYDYKGIYVGKSDPYSTMNLHSKVNIDVTSWLTIGENIEYTYDKVTMGMATNGSSTYTPQARLATYGSPNWTVYNPDGTFTKAGAMILSGLVGDAYDADVPNRNDKQKTVKNFRTTTSATAHFFDNKLRFNADFSFRTKESGVVMKRVAQYFSPAEGAMEYSMSAADQWEQAAKEQFRNYSWITTNEYAEYEDDFGKHHFKAMAGFNYERRNYRQGEYTRYGLNYEDALGENPFAFANGTKQVKIEDVFKGYYLKNGSNYYDMSAYKNIYQKDEDGNYVATGKYFFYNGILSADPFTVKHWRQAGAFFRLNYAYDDRYLLEVNGRYDGSSVFAKGHQWGFFPSMSAGWRVTKEPWWKLSPKLISSLKLRFSYGELGDCQSASAYATEPTYEIKYNDGRVINGSDNTKYLKYPSDVYSLYTWAKARTIDYGVDASFFNNSLDITYDYFIRRNLNMLTKGAEHAATYGSASAIGNNADMSTYGWELGIKYNTRFMLGGKPFHFGARAAIADSYTVVDRFVGNNDKSVKPYQYREGMVIGEVWGFKCNGIFQSEDEINNAFGPGIKYEQTVANQMAKSKVTNVGDLWIMDLNGNNKIDDSDFIDPETGYAGDKTIIGSRKPSHPYSFGFSMDWNNFFFDIGFQGLMHQDYFVSGASLLASPFNSNYGPMTKWFSENYWREDRRDALFPRAAVGNQWMIGNQTNYFVKYSKYPIDRFVYNIGYLNLQNVQLGYNLPKKLISKIGLADAKVYVSGENLYNWSPFYKTFGRDFDVTTISYGGDDADFGLDWYSTLGGYQYPKMRTFSVGVSITFGGGSQNASSGSANASSELAKALAAANAAADAANAAAAKAQAEVDALKAELEKALKAKDDCEAAKDVKPMAVRRAEALHLEDIYFELNQSVIRDSETAKIDNLVKVLKANPEAKVSITGYADQATGTELRNLVLTKERAEVVAEALKAAGIGPDRIHTEFYGTEKDASFTPENNRLAVCIVNN